MLGVPCFESTLEYTCMPEYGDWSIWFLISSKLQSKLEASQDTLKNATVLVEN